MGARLRPAERSLWHYLGRAVSIAVLLLVLALGALVVPCLGWPGPYRSRS